MNNSFVEFRQAQLDKIVRLNSSKPKTYFDMKSFLFIACLFLCVVGFSQTPPKDSSLPYLKNLNLPAFKLIQSIQGTDTTWFTNNNLVKGKSTVIIYFSPDCGHCQIEAKDLVKEKDSLKNANFVWVSYHPMEDIKAFAEKYKLSKLENCIAGRFFYVGDLNHSMIL